jgi:hypothetical protein
MDDEDEPLWMEPAGDEESMPFVEYPPHYYPPGIAQ